MSLTIRNAVKADCPRLLELIKELALFENAPDEVTVSMQEFEDSGFGENPVWWAFVGEYEGEIIGMSLYYIRYSTWKGRRLYLEDIIITESMRGKGFGKDLLDHTIAYAKEQGYSGMMWQVLDWNTPAIDFYKKYNTKFDEEWINVNINF
ncbi:N-acetyltransferase [Sphingobacterium mizutaii NBRC 14946 = DSM 11724]|uniref:Ribosomal-protein-alanine acetyltransferase n=2 Tax=Sphingobacterium mizutaii TaxID=1010 RepID=A0AAJ4XES0_9SPHI|nr:GNAT family N-acetyltransferase [Sphingobacterium mizutaii]GEM69626.1 N-acetyltransferase [Sphingobacterium mizutaii NBRC 14946 = DSM 11724]SDL25110.1 L-amino acid N-acyltransferase YncA [Sphingobacterium mizutaii]SNV53159.1 ribosomal-protein-alanine acetyltransferase [Sphingobacterium mizutaii]